jgi:hypothetical protein
MDDIVNVIKTKGGGLILNRALNDVERIIDKAKADINQITS